MCLRMREAIVGAQHIAGWRRLLPARLHREAEEAVSTERSFRGAQDGLEIRHIDEDVGREHEIRKA